MILDFAILALKFNDFLKLKNWRNLIGLKYKNNTSFVVFKSQNYTLVQI